MARPNISIIIATLNAGTWLQQTLNSIRQQDYPHLEVVVIDGGSSDNTASIISQNQDIITTWVSEKDEGISDAFNKGLQLATGEYINFQGAGDTLYAPDCLERLFSAVDEDVTLVCGQVMRVEEDGKTPIWIAPKKVRPFNKRALLTKMALPHQALFTHRRFFEKFGGFDKKVKFAMDYELLLRAYHQFPKTVVKPILISRWRAGGIGANRIDEIFAEYHRIKIQHRIAFKGLLIGIDKINKFKYWLKTKWLQSAY